MRVSESWRSGWRRTVVPLRGMWISSKGPASSLARSVHFNSNRRSRVGAGNRVRAIDFVWLGTQIQELIRAIKPRIPRCVFLIQLLRVVLVCSLVMRRSCTDASTGCVAHRSPGRIDRVDSQKPDNLGNLGFLDLMNAAIRTIVKTASSFSCHKCSLVHLLMVSFGKISIFVRYRWQG